MSILLALVLIAAAFFLGRVVGKRTVPAACEHLFDPEEARDAGEKGRQVIQERIVRRKERILERARREGRVTLHDTADLFCIGESTARNYLHELVAEGSLLKEGEGGDTTYVPV